MCIWCLCDLNPILGFIIPSRFFPTKQRLGEIWLFVYHLNECQKVSFRTNGSRTNESCLSLSLSLSLSFHHCQQLSLAQKTYCCHKMSTWCTSPAHTDAHDTLPVYVSTVAYQWSCVKPSNRSIWWGEMAVKLLLFQQYYTTAPTSNNMIILVIVWKVFIPRASADAVANNVLCPLSGGYDSVISWSWDIKLLPHHHYFIISQITHRVYFPKPWDNNLIIMVFQGIVSLCS